MLKSTRDKWQPWQISTIKGENSPIMTVEYWAHHMTQYSHLSSLKPGVESCWILVILLSKIFYMWLILVINFIFHSAAYTAQELPWWLNMRTSSLPHFQCRACVNDLQELLVGWKVFFFFFFFLKAVVIYWLSQGRTSSWQSSALFLVQALLSPCILFNLHWYAWETDGVHRSSEWFFFYILFYCDFLYVIC